MTSRIGILEVGRPPQELRGKYRDYTDMTADWLASIGGDIHCYPIMDGCPFPQPCDADLWAITGSKCGVYEDHPWIPPLIAFIREATNTKARLLGICFGHQIMAKALGGEVVKSEKGWGLGLCDYPLQPWPQVLPPPPGPLRINAYHQDQIIRPPEQAVLLATSAFCPYASLWYPGIGISFQGHPEFSKAYEQDLIQLRRGGIIDKAVADAALASLGGENTAADWARWYARNWRSL